MHEQLVSREELPGSPDTIILVGHAEGHTFGLICGSYGKARKVTPSQLIVRKFTLNQAGLMVEILKIEGVESIDIYGKAFEVHCDKGHLSEQDEQRVSQLIGSFFAETFVGAA